LITTRTYTTRPKDRGRPKKAEKPWAQACIQVSPEQLAWLDRLAVGSQRSRSAVMRALVAFAMQHEAQVAELLP
jgi:hypothetical protein